MTNLIKFIKNFTLFKGNCLYVLNRKEEAIESYNKAIELNPKNDSAYYNKGKF